MTDASTQGPVRLGPRRSRSMWETLYRRKARAAAVMRRFAVDPRDGERGLMMTTHRLQEMLIQAQMLAENGGGPIDLHQYIDDQGQPIV